MYVDILTWPNVTIELDLGAAKTHKREGLRSRAGWKA